MKPVRIHHRSITGAKISRSLRLRAIQERRARAMLLVAEMERQGRPAGYVNMVRVMIDDEIKTQIDELNNE